MSQRKKPRREITEEEKLSAEEQIRQEQRVVDYDTKEYTVELLVNKYNIGRDEDENELFIPEYQREFVWDDKRQSKFIESVLLGLPIPYIGCGSGPKVTVATCWLYVAKGRRLYSKPLR